MEGPKIIEIDDEQICTICSQQLHKYACPRCGIKYCSIVCYKSEDHLECSESFYKQCVEEELRLDEKDPETKKKMLDILQRMHEDQGDEMAEIERLAREGLDSDDEAETPDLAERLQHVNLDDADSLWTALTNAERQEFEALLQNGEMEKLLPPWKPWWSHRMKTQLVEDLSESTQTYDYRKDCPKIMETRPFNQISKATPAPCIKNNLLNVLHAYTYTVLYFNGDHHNFIREATSVLLELCNNLRENHIFKELELAIESVSQQAVNCQWLIGDAETLSAMKTACTCILQGPEDSNKYFYLLAALSDLHRLLAEARKMKPVSNSETKNKDFSKRFPDENVITVTAVPKKKLKMYSKKIEYYLSWVQAYGKDMYM